MIPPIRGKGAGRDTKARAASRARLERVLRAEDGSRRLPREAELVAALEGCDPRDVWWTCEMSSHGPVYLLPTREWIRALVRTIRRLGARRVLEVAAGDGFLARCLAEAAPDLEVLAADDGSWERPRGRMSAADRREMRGQRVPGLRLGPNVERLDALRAVRRHRPDLVIVAWAPPGDLVEKLIRSRVSHVLEIGTDGDHCGSGVAAWRYAFECLEGAIQDRAICRLDARPSQGRATRVTRYPGRSHPDFRMPRRRAADDGAIWVEI